MQAWQRAHAPDLVVLDIDKKGGKDGYAELAALGAEHGDLSLTYIVDTPSGGRHQYYHAAGDAVRSTVSKLAEGIDVRANGGYVIAAGPGYSKAEVGTCLRNCGMPPQVPQTVGR